ncbi:hypothetical protein DFQ12_1223 [Sphingobacterium detergens]|uniref:Uncharacterized protein n=2 Tax=Sphingobacterium detergens TaxID=1145106 RepID=A0A420BI25_SPHD1|nr:hypothetical protein DFQ12_1223 [Sphingobacterium detergens]
MKNIYNAVMKKVFFTLFILLTTVVTFAQEYTIDIKEINLFNKAQPTKFVPFDATKTQVLQALGQPVKQYKIYNQMDETSEDVFEYNGKTKLYFNNNKLVSFDILNFRSSPITIGKNGNAVKEPKDLENLYSSIPTKKENTTDGESYLFRRSKVATLKKGTTILDMGLEIKFNFMNGSVAMSSGIDPSTLLQEYIKSIAINTY